MQGRSGKSGRTALNQHGDKVNVGTGGPFPAFFSKNSSLLATTGNIICNDFRGKPLTSLLIKSAEILKSVQNGSAANKVALKQLLLSERGEV